MTGRRFCYDVETDGLLDSLTRIHSLVLRDLDTGEVKSYRRDGTPAQDALMIDGVRILNDASLRVGHNIIKFDELALAKCYPAIFVPNPAPSRIRDTLILTRLIRPNVKDKDMLRVKRGNFPGKLIGSHTLEAWGYRLGFWKGDYSAIKLTELKEQNPELPRAELEALVWASWNPEMQAYCEQDVLVTFELWSAIEAEKYPTRPVEDEHSCALLCAKIEANGFPFDKSSAVKLYGELSGMRAELEDQLRETFGYWFESAGETTPKAGNKTKGVTKGEPYTKIKRVDFNPASNRQIANRLTKLYGWKPTVFTPTGEPKVDDDTLKGLPYPPIPLLRRYAMVLKRLGQLAEGKQAWLQVEKNGLIHGSINSVSAVTRRATHSSPNIAQVPKVKSSKEKGVLRGLAGEYGWECRSLFSAAQVGWFQAGTDASGLELRCLAHFLHRWDGGAYGEILLHGDIHEHNRIAAELPTRDLAKTFIYALLYGAGDEHLGTLIGGDAALGKRQKAKFFAAIPALKELSAAVSIAAKRYGNLLALDGGLLHVRSPHSALNTLLQSAGALICKRWMVTLEAMLLSRGYKHGWDGDFAFLAWVHDELQIACRTPEIAAEIDGLSKAAMKEAEAYFNFKCPLDTETKLGGTWAECH